MSYAPGNYVNTDRRQILNGVTVATSDKELIVATRVSFFHAATRYGELYHLHEQRGFAATKGRSSRRSECLLRFFEPR